MTPASASSRAGRYRNAAVSAVGVGLSLLALGYAVYANREAFLTTTWQLDYRFLFMSFIARAAGMASLTVAWHRIIMLLGLQSNLRRDARIYVLTNLSKRLPTPAFLIAQRASLYAGTGFGAANVSVATSIEIVYTLLGLGICTVVAFFLANDAITSFANLVALAVVAVVVGVLAVPVLLRVSVNIIRKHVPAFPDASVPYSEHIALVMLYVLASISGVVMFAFLVSSFTPIGWSDVTRIALYWNITGIIGLVSGMLPTGLAAREITLAVLLSNLIATPVAVVVAAFSRVWLLLTEAILMVFAAIKL